MSAAFLKRAALLHDVGRAQGPRNHQKKSYRMIREKIPPPGWTAAEMEIVSYDRSISSRRFAKLRPEKMGGNSSQSERKCSISRRNSAPRHCAWKRREFSDYGNESGKCGGAWCVVSSIRVTGGTPGEEPLASRVAAERHLLESVLHRAIVIEPELNRARGISAAN